MSKALTVPHHLARTQGIEKSVEEVRPGVVRVEHFVAERDAGPCSSRGCRIWSEWEEANPAGFAVIHGHPESEARRWFPAITENVDEEGVGWPAISGDDLINWLEAIHEYEEAV